MHEGVVWYGDDTHLATCSDRDIDEFILTPAFRDARLVRILGRAENCGLVEKMYKAHLIAGLDTPVKVQVGSPVMLPYQDPAALLSAMWRASIDKTGIEGYWATLNSVDYVSFALMATVYKDNRVADQALQTAKYHPAWPAVSFIWKFDPIAAIYVLTEIGDPRWFQHPVKPNRLSRLYSHMGLNLANIQFMCDSTNYSGPNINKAVHVINVWRDRETNYSDTKQPQAFLDRIEVSNKYLDRGVLASCRSLIRFVREVWMANRADDPEVEFLPEKFFNRKDEISAYKRHVKNHTLPGPN